MVLPITGVGVGAVQIVRGVANQPGAISEQAHGRVWDEVRDGDGRTKCAWPLRS